ncbi:MAG: CHAT domain-containing protein [Phormidesmis sp. RL_2_1]|nr:CHAT domain-containing protein [Phormidesmis sp. RL_2_1]
MGNIAAAYQRLGQFSAAQTALAESLALLQAAPAKDLIYWQISARVLNIQGQDLWQQGQTQQALNVWQQAEASYRKAEAVAAADFPGRSNAALENQPMTDQSQSLLLTEQNSGLLLVQINQALALQELGLNVQAVRRLIQLDREQAQLSPSLRLVLDRELAQAYRRVGELSEAYAVLSKGVAVARQQRYGAADQRSSDGTAGTAAPPMTPEQLALMRLELELAHTVRSLSHQAITVGKVAEANAYAEEALIHYRAVSAISRGALADLPDHALLQVQAELNQLSYLIEMGRLTAAQALWPEIDLSVLVPGRSRTEAYISYAHSLACLRSPSAVACVRQEWQEELGRPVAAAGPPVSWETVAEALAEAIRQARSLADPLLESYGLGELGHIYELAGQWTEAIGLTQQALALLEGKQLPDVAYQWQWQLGRLYDQPLKGQSERPVGKSYRSEAIAAYQQALDSVAAARQNLLVVNLQVQFSFRDTVEPLYREFVALLLAQPSDDGTRPEPPLLDLAVQTLDALHLSELENFLGCELSQLVNLNEVGVDPKAAKIYPILLPDYLAIVVDIPHQPPVLRGVAVSQTTVEETIEDLRYYLTVPGKTQAVLTAASQLYQWLMGPIAPILAANDVIETLVFVPDGPLRNIPMGVLYDGEQYLVEKSYAIAVAPQLDLFAPRASVAPLQVLRGGVGLPQTIRKQQFPTIELLRAELDQIPAELTVATPLINEAFTKANIEQQLANEQYSAIHWKTHGVFSSDPEETFLVAYQAGITANELSALVQSARARQREPLELLVLSACETAQGDRRAVLGLAGIAVRAGTRSTLSTLWRADDGANTQLMAYFYAGLKQGLTKAQALQAGQRALITEQGYPAPYYWAPYVLVGNWL